MSYLINKIRPGILSGSLPSPSVLSARFLILTILWLSSGDIFSQQMISRDESVYTAAGGNVICTPECTIYLKPAYEGKNYSFTIPLLAAESGYTHTFEFDPPCDCSSGSIDINPTTGEINMTANNFCLFTPNPDTIEIGVKVTRDPGGPTDAQMFYIPIVRRPFKLVFVLDISGSMGTPVQGSSESRWIVLNRAVNTFMNALEGDSVKGDQIALTYFTDYLVSPGPPMEDRFLKHTDGYTPLNNKVSKFISVDMGGRGPLARTSLGMGLQNAKLKLTRYQSADTTRLIFVFTDGIQNEPPFVDPDGITLESGTIQINDGDPAAEGSIKICVTEVESFTPYADMLTNLAENNRGFYQTITIGDMADFIANFQDQLTNMLKTYSPQMIARKNGIIQNGQSSESFIINDGVGRVYFQLTFNNGDSLSLQVEKDGVDVTKYATINKAGYFESVNFNLPLYTNPKTTSKGKWLVKISGQNGKIYSLIGIADDHFLKYNCSLQKKDYDVGEPLKLSVDLKHNEVPLDSSVNIIKAVILKPGEDIGHLLATKGWDYHNPDSDIVDAATQKYIDLFRNDSTFYEALLPSEQVVLLNHDSAGYYSGQFNKTDISGIYKVIFLMKGEIPELGSFERTETHSQLIKFAETSDTKTEVKTSADTLKGTVTIKVRPMNKFGKYMGPGLKNWIRVTVKSEAVRNVGVLDNLDGSYSFIFTGVSPDDNPTVTISIRDKILRQKPLSGITSPKSVWTLWQLLVLLILLILLIYGYVKKSISSKIPKWLLWLLLLIWIVILILVKLGILNL